MKCRPIIFRAPFEIEIAAEATLVFGLTEMLVKTRFWGIATSGFGLDFRCWDFPRISLRKGTGMAYFSP